MIYLERHNDGFAEDLRSLDHDIKDIYSIAMDVKVQQDVIDMTPVDFQGELIRTINYSMWFVNESLSRVIESLNDMEDYLSVGLVEADELDEDDPLVRARKVDFLCLAHKLAGVIVAYGEVVTRTDPERTALAMNKLQFIYNKLAYILQHYHVFDGENVFNDDVDVDEVVEDDVDDEHRPELMEAREAVMAAKNDNRRLIVNECLRTMAGIVVEHTIPFTSAGYFKKWKSRIMSVGRYFVNLFRSFQR